MNAEMDQIETNCQKPGICHRLLISVLPRDCPVCKALAICRRIFNFRPSAAPSLAAENLLPMSSGGLLQYGLSILQRMYDFIMQILLSQAIKPVTLGSFKDNGPIEIERPDLQASQSENGIETRNDQNILLNAHQDPSAEKYCQPMADEKQAKEADDSARQLTDLYSSWNCPGDERGLSQVKSSTGDDVHSSPIVQEKRDEEEQEKVPTPTVMQKPRAPKKMVSINENVEIFPISMNNRKKSKEWLSATESWREESKPLKSILKVGSKLTNVSTE